jgi:hypothetical protein
MVAIFSRPELMEVAFMRLKMHQGVGIAIVYSHRVYGKKPIEPGHALKFR